jgi:hypothetical protein
MKFRVLVLAALLLTLGFLWAQNKRSFSISISPPSSTPTGIPLSACGTLNIANGRYYLTNDVSAANTCFSVKASGIILDLNGYSITYGTGNTTNRRHGILGIACSSLKADGNPCDGTFNNFTVRNGKIFQGGGGAYSHAVSFGPGGGDGLIVENVEFDVWGESAKAIYGTYVGGAKISFNKAYSTSTKVTNRHQLDGVLIALHEGVNEAPSEIWNNELHGSPQGGILVTSKFSKVHHNIISLNGFYTNDFCIYAWGGSQEVYSNYCDNTQGNDGGRGIQLNSPDIKVYDNVVRVRELPRNVEYLSNGLPSCEAGGAYGIQTEKATYRASIYNNHITAIAGACQASAFRLSGGEVGNPAKNIIRANVVRVLRESPTSPGMAIGFSFRGCNDCTVQDHTDVVVDQYCYHDITQTGTEPASVVILSNNSCKKGANASSSFRSWYMDNYGGVGTVNITGIGLVFPDSAGTDIRSYAIGQPLQLQHKPFTIFLNNQWKIYNTTTQAAVVEGIN